MENKTFQQAKKLNDQIDELSAYLNKLYHAKGDYKVKEVKITYHVGQYDTKCEVALKPEASDFIEEMIKKEINRIVEERSKLQDEFDKL
jgi:hypothetical protein